MSARPRETRLAASNTDPLGKVCIAEGGLDVGMAEQPGDEAQAQALAAVDRDRYVGVPEVVNAQRRKSRLYADRVACLVDRCSPAVGQRETPTGLVK